jgi:hypothetical protein
MVKYEDFKQKFNAGNPIEFQPSSKTGRYVGFIHGVSIVCKQGLKPIVGGTYYVTYMVEKDLFVLTDKSGYNEALKIAV